MLLQFHPMYEDKTSVLMTAKGRMRDFPDGRLEAVGAFLRYAETRLASRSPTMSQSPTMVVMPEGLVMTSRDLSEYGRRGIGLDYALELGDWIRASYDLEHVFEAGEAPSFLLLLLRRR